MKYEVYLIITDNKSGIPSPVIPEVGTIGKNDLISLFSQYKIAFFSISAN